MRAKPYPWSFVECPVCGTELKLVKSISRDFERHMIEAMLKKQCPEHQHPTCIETPLWIPKARRDQPI